MDFLGPPPRSGLIFPTGPVKPPASGSGLPDQFDQKPVEFKSEFKSARTTGSDRLDQFTGPVWPVTGVLKINSNGLKMAPRCEIKENFGMTYAHINVNDHTKATIYNHTYKYNSNKRAYKYRVIHLYTSNKSST